MPTDYRSGRRGRWPDEYDAYDYDYDAAYDRRYHPDDDDDYDSERGERPAPRSRSRIRSLGHDLADRFSQSLGLGRSSSRRSSSPGGRRRARSIDDDYGVRGRAHRRAGSPVTLTPSPSPSPPPRSRHRATSASRNRRTAYYPSSRHRSLDSRARDDRDAERQRRQRQRWQHAARAGFDTAVVEAFRLRKEPGPWTSGGKVARVATAGLGAAAAEALLDKDPDRHGKRKTVEAAVAGLLVNRLVNGPRDDLRRRSRR